MDPALRLARVAGLLAASVFAAALWPERSAGPACADPREAKAVDGHTRVVECRADRPGGPLRGPARLLFGLGLDPNRADAVTLAELPGIGPARAAAIIAGREAGPYRRTRDLTRVHGIGPKTAGRLAPWLYFPEAEAGLQERR